MKRNYEKHVETLQKNLDEQIRINKQTRDRVMNEANSMIENERNRLQKIHDEELSRVKQISEWEKKKV